MPIGAFCLIACAAMSKANFANIQEDLAMSTLIEQVLLGISLGIAHTLLAADQQAFRSQDAGRGLGASVQPSKCWCPMAPFLFRLVHLLVGSSPRELVPKLFAEACAFTSTRNAKSMSKIMTPITGSQEIHPVVGAQTLGD